MDIGFFIPEINSDVVSHDLIDNINKLCKIRPYDNIAIFNNYFNLIDHNKQYYTLSINHAKYFNGLLFLFRTEDAFLTQTFACPKKQILYLNEPEWLKSLEMPYTVWYNIYMSNNFEIISGNEHIHKLFEICWKPPIKQISNFHYKEIDNVIQSI